MVDMKPASTASRSSSVTSQPTMVFQICGLNSKGSRCFVRSDRPSSVPTKRYICSASALSL